MTIRSFHVTSGNPSMDVFTITNHINQPLDYLFQLPPPSRFHLRYTAILKSIKRTWSSPRTLARIGMDEWWCISTISPIWRTSQSVSGIPTMSTTGWKSRIWDPIPNIASCTDSSTKSAPVLSRPLRISPQRRIVSEPPISELKNFIFYNYEYLQ